MKVLITVIVITILGLVAYCHFDSMTPEKSEIDSLDVIPRHCRFCGRVQ